jgi:hypothetical protein
MRAPLLALISILALALLAGCPAEEVGRLAAAVNAEGEPVLVMASCDGPPYAISVSGAVTGTDPEEELDWRRVLRLENDSPRVEDPAAISLVYPGDQWTVVSEDHLGFDDTRLFKATAWTENDKYLGTVQFDLDRLDALDDGEVLYQDAGEDRVAPVSEFVDSILAEC